MSHIDSIRHEFLGYFNGLPIYHPLESLSGPNRGDYDFGCTPDNLVIGGGSGEHPALILHDLGGLAAFYLVHCVGEDALDCENTYNCLYEMALRADEHLEFCAWPMHLVHHFVEQAKSPLHGTPWNTEAESVEDWIKASMGEFIFFSLPELNPDYQTIINLSGIRRLKPQSGLGPWLNNVFCPPPHYAKSKKDAPLDPAFGERGVFRWDYAHPPQTE